MAGPPSSPPRIRDHLGPLVRPWPAARDSDHRSPQRKRGGRNRRLTVFRPTVRSTRPKARPSAYDSMIAMPFTSCDRPGGVTRDITSTRPGGSARTCAGWRHGVQERGRRGGRSGHSGRLRGRGPITRAPPCAAGGRSTMTGPAGATRKPSRWPRGWCGGARDWSGRRSRPSPGALDQHRGREFGQPSGAPSARIRLAASRGRGTGGPGPPAPPEDLRPPRSRTRGCPAQGRRTQDGCRHAPPPRPGRRWRPGCRVTCHPRRPAGPRRPGRARRAGWRGGPTAGAAPRSVHVDRWCRQSRA